MANCTKDDLKNLMENLTTNFGDQIVQVTTHIDKMFPPTDLSLWMDTVGGHTGTWWHRVKHGQDIINLDLVYEKFGVEGVLKYPFEIGKDSMTPHGIPLPGVQSLHQNGYVGARTATEWLSFTVGDKPVGGVAIHSTYRLHKKSMSGKLSTRDVIWASVGSILKITVGAIKHSPVLIASGVADGVIILENLTEIKELFSDLGFDIDSVLKAAAAGVVAGGLAATGAFTATAAFASASTGTAIASLSGVAATNATLAAIGGGALSAGGLGIMGGLALLSGGAILVALGAGAAVWAYNKS